MRMFLAGASIAVLLFGGLLSFSQQSPASQSPTSPLSVADVEHGLKAGVSNTRMAALVKQYGVDFELTDVIEKQLRAAGATGDLLLDINRNIAATETAVNPESRLMWTTNDNGVAVNWDEATTYCRNLGFGGYTDWRLPEIGEWESKNDPSFSHSYLYAVWSASRPESDEAWFFVPDYGKRFSNPVASLHRAFCVRRSIGSRTATAGVRGSSSTSAGDVKTTRPYQGDAGSASTNSNSVGSLDAHDCIARTSGPSGGGVFRYYLAFRNTCTTPVHLYFCYTTAGKGCWGCVMHGQDIETKSNTDYSAEIGAGCQTQSCSELQAVWNATYVQLRADSRPNEIYPKKPNVNDSCSTTAH